MSIQISTPRVTQDQAEHNLGDVFCDERHNKKYVYVKAGSSALTVGNLQQAPALITNHTNQTVAAAAAIGDTTVTVDLGNTAATANQYSGGTLVINDATGEGYHYNVLSHPAADASAELVLTLSEPIKVALVADTSEYTLVANPYNGVIKSATTETGVITGVAHEPIPASEYGWLQVFGTAAVLIDGTPEIGAKVARSNGTTGAVEVADGALGGPVGQMVATGVSGEHNPVHLNIPVL